MIFRAMRLLGALAVLGIGAVHLQRYFGADYRSIPTIGPLFMLNAISAGIVAIGLLLPIERTLPPRAAPVWLGSLASSGVAIGAGSLAALFISENGGLFGFHETGHGTPILLAIIAESATILLLAPVAAACFARALAERRTAGTRRQPARPAGSSPDAVR